MPAFFFSEKSQYTADSSSFNIDQVSIPGQSTLGDKGVVYPEPQRTSSNWHCPNWLQPTGLFGHALPVSRTFPEAIRGQRTRRPC